MESSKREPTCQVMKLKLRVVSKVLPCLVLFRVFLGLVKAVPSSAFLLHHQQLRKTRTSTYETVTFLSSSSSSTENNNNNGDSYLAQQYRPIPVMPSQLFQQLALSQLELLASSITASPGSRPKIKSMALYLPQENVQTGQLEFLPAVRYPHPSSERIFIANDSESGKAPQMPRTLTTLPGFADATTLLPGYPMVSSSGSDVMGIGVVEEVMCQVDYRTDSGRQSGGGGGAGAALSVPLFSGTQTVGVLLVSPSVRPKSAGESVWTKEDKEKVSQAAKSLSLALSMDTERTALQILNRQVQEALSDSLHQVKNPLQALRTFGKLLQRRIADGEEAMTGAGMTPQLLELAEHLLVQSDRLADRLRPVDALVESLSVRSETQRPHLLQPGPTKEELSLARFQTPLLPQQGANAKSGLKTGTAQTSSIPGVTDNISASGNNQNSALADTNSLVIPLQKSSDAQRGQQMERTTTLLINESNMELAFASDLLDPLFSSYRAIAADSGISFVVEESDDLPGITVCPEALQEVVTNLIDNALKYVLVPSGTAVSNNKGIHTPPQVRIRLLSNDLKSRGAGVTVLVEDSGPGIALHDRERVFERGYRGTTVAEKAGGKGIGLGIARSLVEQMGGSLRVANNEEYSESLKGAVMEVVLYRNPRS